MRTIEQQMINAIRDGKSRSLGNTRVEVDALGNWRVYLHNNLIANGGSREFSFTLAGWGTTTTRSRVNALLAARAQGCARVYQSKGAQHFSQWGKSIAIDSDDWVTPLSSDHSEAALGLAIRLA
jgi:hypothetical protein